MPMLSALRLGSQMKSFYMTQLIIVMLRLSIPFFFIKNVCHKIHDLYRILLNIYFSLVVAGPHLHTRPEVQMLSFPRSYPASPAPLWFVERMPLFFDFSLFAVPLAAGSLNPIERGP